MSKRKRSQAPASWRAINSTQQQRRDTNPLSQPMQLWFDKMIQAVKQKGMRFCVVWRTPEGSVCSDGNDPHYAKVDLACTAGAAFDCQLQRGRGGNHQTVVATRRIPANRIIGSVPGVVTDNRQCLFNQKPIIEIDTHLLRAGLHSSPLRRPLFFAPSSIGSPLSEVRDTHNELPNVGYFVCLHTETRQLHMLLYSLQTIQAGEELQVERAGGPHFALQCLTAFSHHLFKYAIMLEEAATSAGLNLPSACQSIATRRRFDAHCVSKSIRKRLCAVFDGKKQWLASNQPSSMLQHLRAVIPEVNGLCKLDPTGYEPEETRALRKRLIATWETRSRSGQVSYANAESLPPCSCGGNSAPSSSRVSKASSRCADVGDAVTEPGMAGLAAPESGMPGLASVPVSVSLASNLPDAMVLRSQPFSDAASSCLRCSMVTEHGRDALYAELFEATLYHESGPEGTTPESTSISSGSDSRTMGLSSDDQHEYEDRLGSQHRLHRRRRGLHIDHDAGSVDSSAFSARFGSLDGHMQHPASEIAQVLRSRRQSRGILSVYYNRSEPFERGPDPIVYGNTVTFTAKIALRPQMRPLVQQLRDLALLLADGYATSRQRDEYHAAVASVKPHGIELPSLDLLKLFGHIHKTQEPPVHVVEIVSVTHQVRRYTPPNRPARAVVAAKAFAVGEPVLVYSGRLRRQEEVSAAEGEEEQAYAYTVESDCARRCGVQLPRSMILESQTYGNEARFINDSWGIAGVECNCEAKVQFDPFSCAPVIVISAIRPIEVGDELFMTYGNDTYWEHFTPNIVDAHQAFVLDYLCRVRHLERLLQNHNVKVPGFKGSVDMGRIGVYADFFPSDQSESPL